MYNNRQRFAIDKYNREKLLELYPRLTNESGIYILTRRDENGLKYAYIGQAKHILTRLVQHLSGYQHIDLSLKKHKFYGEDNPYGWQVFTMRCGESKLDEKEKEYIRVYAEHGYQLRNKTAGGQGVGKVGIDDNRASKGYYDGLRQGEINAKRKLRKWFGGSLKAVIDGKETKIKERYLTQFNEYIGAEENEVDTDTNDTQGE